MVLTDIKKTTSAPGTPQAPADGRLAAAMATISLSRRPIRDGAERSNEPNCRMSPIPSAPAGTSVLQTALNGK
jgi:hypothetical protein